MLTLNLPATCFVIFLVAAISGCGKKELAPPSQKYAQSKQVENIDLTIDGESVIGKEAKVTPSKSYNIGGRFQYDGNRAPMLTVYLVTEIGGKEVIAQSANAQATPRENGTFTFRTPVQMPPHNGKVELRVFFVPEGSVDTTTVVASEIIELEAI